MSNFDIRSANRHEISWPVIRSGLWLRLAFLGAAFVAYGLASAIAGELGLAASLGFVAGGGSVASFALRRSFQMVDEAQGTPAAKVPVATSAALRTGEA